MCTKSKIAITIYFVFLVHVISASNVNAETKTKKELNGKVPSKYIGKTKSKEKVKPKETPTFPLPTARIPVKTKDPVIDVKKGQPTYINSDSLIVESNNKIFKYSGNVIVTQGDLTLKSDFLDGFYTEQNKIKQLVARKNVLITKGTEIKATSEKAIYNAETSIITLTENPQLYQQGNILSADSVKIYVKENKSSAEGQVRVKFSGEDGENKNSLNDSNSKN